MYRPAAFRIDDSPRLLDFVEQHSFATVVTHAAGEMTASHVPVLADCQAGELMFHLARSNPQADQLRAGTEVLCIFQGPHCYVSPAWYAASPAVPTWNYAAVHVYGKARVLEGEELLDLLERIVETYEAGRERPWVFDRSSEWNRNMARGIVGFAIPISRIEGKFKMNRNRSEEDRQGVIRALEQSQRQGDREVARFMRQS